MTTSLRLRRSFDPWIVRLSLALLALLALLLLILAKAPSLNQDRRARGLAPRGPEEDGAKESIAGERERGKRDGGISRRERRDAETERQVPASLSVPLLRKVTND